MFWLCFVLQNILTGLCIKLLCSKNQTFNISDSNPTAVVWICSENCKRNGVFYRIGTCSQEFNSKKLHVRKPEYFPWGNETHLKEPNYLPLFNAGWMKTSWYSCQILGWPGTSMMTIWKLWPVWGKSCSWDGWVLKQSQKTIFLLKVMW